MDFEHDIFQHPESGEPPEAGMLLVASPRLRDPYFREAVVLLINQDTNGGFLGLILNSPTKITLADVTGRDDSSSEHKIYCGGPVEEDRLFTLHCFGDMLGAVHEIGENLFVGADFELLSSLFSEHGVSVESIRFFMGYCGWTKGQLEEEIAAGYWGLLKTWCAPCLLRGSGKDYWRSFVKDLGDDYRSWLLMPDNPRDN